MNPNKSNPLFYWQGKDRFGEKRCGKISAPDKIVLSQRLNKQGIIILRILPCYSRYTIQRYAKYFQKTPHSAEITSAIRQLSMLLSAHIPLIQALIAIQAHLSHTFKPIIASALTEIHAGRTLSYALGHYPKCFNPLFCRWIEAGEHTGTLDVLLEYWANYQEKSDVLRQKVKKALSYPVFILVITVIVAMILLICVIPVFEHLFHQFGAKLPLVTQYMINISHVFQYMGIPILLIGMVGFIILWYMRRYFPKLAYRLDKIQLHIPIIGKMMQEIALTRFTKALSVMLSAGFPLSEALQWTAKTMKNCVLTQAIMQSHAAVLSGVPLSQAIMPMMSSTPHFFSLLLKQMIAVGETSGALDETLAKTADFYEKKVFSRVDNMSQLIEPVIMVILGIFTGGFIIAMYMPIFQLSGLF